MPNSLFSKRFTQACDDSPYIPSFGKGRQVTIAKELDVSQEAVRKWLCGDAMPRPVKMTKLAKLLRVDEAWLALGVDPEMDREHRLDAKRVTEGAVLVLVGMVTMEGGRCAFPTEDDPRKAYVDFYAIVRGSQFAIHVSVARELSKSHYEVYIPREYRDVRCVAYVPRGPMQTPRILGLPIDLLEQHKQRKSGGYCLALNEVNGKFMTGGDTWPRLKSMGAMV